MEDASSINSHKTQISTEPEVILICGPRGYKIREPLMAVNLYVHELYRKNSPWRTNLKTLIKLTTLLHQNSIIMADYPGYFALAGLMGSRVASRPFVLRLRGDVSTGLPQWQKGLSLQLRQFIARYVIRHSDLIISVSDYLAKRIITELNVPADRVTTVPIPVTRRTHSSDRALRPPHIAALLDQYRGYTLIVSVANLEFKGKALGLCKFIPILERLLSRRQNIIWFVAGAGKHVQSLQQELARFPSLSGKVHLLGYVEPVQSLIDCADLIVYFSYEDGFPNVPLEAQIEGKVVVVNEFDPLLEQVEHGVTGLVVDPTDIERAVSLIWQVLEDEALYRRIAESARDSALRRYDIATVGRQFGQAFHRLHKRPQSP